MATVCDGHGDARSGPVRSLYATLVDDGRRLHAHKKYCINCMTEVFKDHHKDWLPGIAAYGLMNIEACTWCGVTAESEARLKPFYVTAYTQKQQRVDYYAYYCDECSGLVSKSFELKEYVNGKS